MHDATSLSLLERIGSAENDAAWEQFVRIYEPLLQQWLRRRGIPEHVADDIRQDVLLVISQEIGRFEHNGRTGAFRNWLRQILAQRMRTVTRRYHRDAARRAPEVIELGDQLADPNSDLSQLWNREHDHLLLGRLLELVAPRFQERSLQAFERVVLQGQEASEVASELEMTVNAVRVAQSRVLAALREVGTGMLD